MERPKIGLGIIIARLDTQKVLLGLRKGAHGNGEWSFPGGHLEPGESFSSCAKREVLEEVGWVENQQYILLEPDAPKFVTNDIFPEGKHYVTLFFRGEYINGKPGVMEPDKCETWDWFSWDNQSLPKNLFLPIRNLRMQRCEVLRGLC